jgi:hypothetical protein
VSSDGRRFLVTTAVKQQASSPITVVLNWTTGLKTKLSSFKKEKHMALTNSLAGRNLGMLLLGLWLILTGLLPLLNMRLSSTVTTGLGVLGIVAGILILLRR